MIRADQECHHARTAQQVDKARDGSESLEMPIMLTICALQLGLALSIVDAAIWRVAMAIPFTCAGMVLFAAIYAAIRYADDWA